MTRRFSRHAACDRRAPFFEGVWGAETPPRCRADTGGPGVAQTVRRSPPAPSGHVQKAKERPKGRDG